MHVHYSMSTTSIHSVIGNRKSVNCQSIAIQATSPGHSQFFCVWTRERQEGLICHSTRHLAHEWRSTWNLTWIYLIMCGSEFFPWLTHHDQLLICVFQLPEVRSIKKVIKPPAIISNPPDHVVGPSHTCTCTRSYPFSARKNVKNWEWSVDKAIAVLLLN